MPSSDELVEIIRSIEPEEVAGCPELRQAISDLQVRIASTNVGCSAGSKTGSRKRPMIAIRTLALSVKFHFPFGKVLLSRQ